MTKYTLSLLLYCLLSRPALALSLSKCHTNALPLCVLVSGLSPLYPPCSLCRAVAVVLNE